MDRVTHQLSNGSTLIIREATPADAADVLAYAHAAGAESDFLSFGPGELDITEQQEVAFRQACLDGDNKLCIMGCIDGTFVAMLHFEGGRRPRMRHAGEFGMTVRKQYWRLGIGSLILEALLDWARANPIVTKINLRVRTDNHKAIALYENKGFVHEGTIRKDLRIGEQYFDHHCMGLEL